MATRITFEELRERAQRAGLELPEAELERLLAGVNRSHEQAEFLRTLFSQETEPAAHFTAGAGR